MLKKHYLVVTDRGYTYCKVLRPTTEPEKMSELQGEIRDLYETFNGHLKRLTLFLTFFPNAIDKHEMVFVVFYMVDLTVFYIKSVD